MKNLFLQIVTANNEDLVVKIREISDAKFQQIINDYDDNYAKEITQNEFVINFYKTNNISLPENMLFDCSYDDDNLYLIDEINTRDLLDL
jgi:hypothetical protein